MMIGNYDASQFRSTATPTPLDITTIPNKNAWSFDLDQFAFGKYEENDDGSEVTSSYYNLTTTGQNYSEALMTIAHPGIGLPSDLYVQFEEMIQNITSNIWVCKDKYGYYCYAPVKCDVFNGDENSSYDLTDYDFKI
jgi:hypothetical protein